MCVCVFDCACLCTTNSFISVIVAFCVAMFAAVIFVVCLYVCDETRCGKAPDVQCVYATGTHRFLHHFICSCSAVAGGVNVGFNVDGDSGGHVTSSIGVVVGGVDVFA